MTDFYLQSCYIVCYNHNTFIARDCTIKTLKFSILFTLLISTSAYGWKWNCCGCWPFRKKQSAQTQSPYVSNMSQQSSIGNQSVFRKAIQYVRELTFMPTSSTQSVSEGDPEQKGSSYQPPIDQIDQNPPKRKKQAQFHPLLNDLGAQNLDKKSSKKPSRKDSNDIFKEASSLGNGGLPLTEDPFFDPQLESIPGQKRGALYNTSFLYD